MFVVVTVWKLCDQRVANNHHLDGLKLTLVDNGMDAPHWGAQKAVHPKNPSSNFCKSLESIYYIKQVHQEEHGDPQNPYDNYKIDATRGKKNDVDDMGKVDEGFTVQFLLNESVN